jgi:hypothetical protein
LDCVDAILPTSDLGRGVSPSRAALGAWSFAARQKTRKALPQQTKRLEIREIMGSKNMREISLK